MPGLESKKKFALRRRGGERAATHHHAMKTTLLLACLACTPILRAADDAKTTPAPAKEEGTVNELPRVSAGDMEGVRKLIGKKAVVFGKVISANESDKAGMSFLDLDGGKFTVVSWKADYPKFEQAQSPAKLYKGKDVEVTGEIFEYRAKGKGDPKLEIKLTDPAQIKVVTVEKEGDKKDDKTKKDGKPAKTDVADPIARDWLPACRAIESPALQDGY